MNESQFGEVPATSPDSGPATNADLSRWAQALSALARNGLAYTESPFEKERYEEVVSIAAAMMIKADRGDGGQPIEPAQLVETWLASTETRTYVTPRVAIGVVVGDDQGRLLLIKRADSGVWLYPTGWADIGYSPAEVAEKEVREETGIECRVERLIAVYDGLRAGFSQTALYSLVFFARAVGGDLRALPHECLDVGFFDRNSLPEPVINAELWVDTAFDAIDGSNQPVWFDKPRPDIWG